MTRMSKKLDATMVFFARLLLEPDVYMQARCSTRVRVPLIAAFISTIPVPPFQYGLHPCGLTIDHQADLP
jgi:hypothetical protein